MLGGALILGGAGFLVKTFVEGRAKSDLPFLLENRDRAIAFATGLAGGFIVGLTSVGTGTFFGLVMLLVFPLTAAKVVGTDIFHAAALLWVAGAGHVVAGNVDFAAMGWLSLGSIPGVLLGSQLTVRLPDRTLRVALATVLTVSGIKLLDPPGANPLLIAAAVLGVLLALALEAKWLNGRGPAPANAEAGVGLGGGRR